MTVITPKGESSSQGLPIIGVYYSSSASFRTLIHFLVDRSEDMVVPESVRFTLPRSMWIGPSVPPHKGDEHSQDIASI